MNRINVLDPVTSNKIAAGEVVERPFSVVKELIENSIDANAKNIIIEIEDGGQKRIKITDDGTGIHPDDLEKAFFPHATSKISVIDDIFKIKTMGFRGEALASIAAVTRLNMKSRINTSDFGKEISISGGRTDFIKEAGCNVGTSIEVSDIFYNVPARQKFLKSSQREASLITDIVERLAIANNKVSFKLINNGKEVLHTYSSNNLIDIIRNIYGKNTCENLYEIESHSDISSLYGFIGNSELSRGSRNNQSIFVNKRYIKNKLITTAVENAYKSFITINKFPFFILFIDIYPELVDVNVHPTKTEVKFNNDREIYKIVFDAVHKTLRDNLKNSFSIDTNELDVKNESIELPQDYKIQIELPIDLHSDLDMKNSIIREPVTFSASEYTSKANPQNNYASNKNIEPKAYDSREANIPQVKAMTAKLPSLSIIGQFNRTYIIAEAQDNLFIIDQHAAHEKVLFEKYMNEIKTGTVTSQILLTPIVVEMSSDDFSYYNESKDLFEKSGFNIDLFGDNTISIREVPMFLGKPNIKNLFNDILDNIKNLGSGKTTEVKYDVIATKACKAAVKAHDKLSMEEMNYLIEQMSYSEDPYTCPHGRPTIIKITLNELEKKFKRII